MKLNDYKYTIEVEYRHPVHPRTYDVKKLRPREVQSFCTELTRRDYVVLTLEIFYHNRPAGIYNTETCSWSSVLNNIMISLQRESVIKLL